MQPERLRVERPAVPVREVLKLDFLHRPAL
jgi:hypothetical protein